MNLFGVLLAICFLLAAASHSFGSVSFTAAFVLLGALSTVACFMQFLVRLARGQQFYDSDFDD